MTRREDEDQDKAEGNYPEAENLVMRKRRTFPLEFTAVSASLIGVGALLVGLGGAALFGPPKPPTPTDCTPVDGATVKWRYQGARQPARAHLVMMCSDGITREVPIAP